MRSVECGLRNAGSGFAHATPWQTARATVSGMTVVGRNCKRLQMGLDKRGWFVIQTSL